MHKLETNYELAHEHRKRLQQQFHELTTDDVATTDNVASLSPHQQVVANLKSTNEESRSITDVVVWWRQ
ncbi:hypothetical protein [Halogranum rubrum]|uniref:Uncharacterized protein n=1 Tax=Halogranum salarium B-1 TaxID=1210908 RepID=J3JDG3_9EURY|nr:hypothetical protein [Halogranum salarium]EJN57464.1 hypothetical protein HSB1_41520 [Halogranum salarium B-1]